MSGFARQTAALVLILIPSGLSSADGSPTDKMPSIPQLGFAYKGWTRVCDDFLPPASGPGPVRSEKDHPYHTGVCGKGSTPLRVADLSNPILKPWAIEQMRKWNELALAGTAYEARGSCRPGGVPGWLVYGRINPTYFVQAPKEVVIINSGGPEVRRIYLNVPHSAHVNPSPYGESVGHYEDNALVVDTIGLSADTFVDNYRTPHTTQEHVVERYTLADAGKTLNVDIWVEDPGAFNMPWSARQSYGLGEWPRNSFHGQLADQLCAEYNPPGPTVQAMPEAKKPDF